MSKYKSKQCLLCNNLFDPTSPKQKYCINCKEEGKKIGNRKRDRIRNREKYSYQEYHRICKVCGREFVTFYKKKLYCGSEACESQRLKLKNKLSHSMRDKEYLRKKGIRYYYNNRIHNLKVKAETYRKTHECVKEYIFGKKVHNHSLDYVKEYVESRGYKLLSDEYINNNTKIKLLCPNNHEWLTTFHGFQDSEINGEFIRGARCLHCYASGDYVSRPEQKIRDYFLNNYPNIEVIYNDRKQIYPKELDFYFPEQQVAVEVCGLYWHSENIGNKPKRYHFDKMMTCCEQGIRLITLFEDEINNKFDIVVSRLLQALHLTPNRLYARKCEVREIENKEATGFLDTNHIQGKSGSIKSWGLFNNNILVGVATVGKINRKHTSTGDTLELKRFCTLNNTVVVGGAHKLFKHVKEFAKKEGYSIIKSYCDMRYANIFNPIYEYLGFMLEGLTEYSPHYVLNGVRYRNFSLRKTPEERLLGKTEWELRKEQGYERVWDCGHRTYVYYI